MPSLKSIVGFVALRCRVCFTMPSVRFPIDAQLPPVAVVGQPFSFTMSPTTFASTLSLQYSTNSLPAWLHFERSTGTLSGTPTQWDVGDVDVELVANDREGRASSQVHLIVLEASSVSSRQDELNRKLTLSGKCSTPSDLLLYPETPFNLEFGPSIFESNGTKLDFYGTSENHAPLPAWMIFDANLVRFSGRSPSLLTPESSPQTFNFCVLASQVPKFSESALHFQISVTNHMLYFVNTTETIDLSAGNTVTIPSMIDLLRYDGNQASRDQLTTVSSTAPDWLAFNQTDLSFQGVVPPDVHDAAFNLQVADDDNNIAKVDFRSWITTSPRHNATDHDLGTLTVVPGRWFAYAFIDMVAIANESSIQIQMEPGRDSPWLTFEDKNVSIQGVAPRNLGGSNFSISTTATRDGTTVQSDRLTLLFSELPETTTDGTLIVASRTAQSTTRQSGISTVNTVETHKNRLKKYLALTVALPIVFVLFTVCAVMILTRRRQKQRARQMLLRQSMQEQIQSDITSHTDMTAETNAQNETATHSQAPASAPQLTLPWAEARPPTRKPWPFAGNGTSGGQQLHSSWDEMLRDIRISRSQSVRHRSRERYDTSSDFTNHSIDRCSSQYHTEDQSMSRDLSANIIFCQKQSEWQIPLNKNIATCSVYEGGGHGTLNFIPHFQHATLKHVSLSPLLEPPPAVHSTRGLDLIDEPLLSRFRSASEAGGMKTADKSGSDKRSLGKRSFSIGSSKENEPDEGRTHPLSQIMWQRVSPTPFSGSVWEDEDFTTEESASRPGNWRVDEPGCSTSQMSAGFSREGSSVRPRHDGFTRHTFGLSSNAVSTGSQETQGSHSNSLRFV